MIGAEVFLRRRTDEDDGLGVEALGLVDRGVVDGALSFFLLREFQEVSAGEHAAVAERTLGDFGLGMEDEYIGGIAGAGFLPAC